MDSNTISLIIIVACIIMSAYFSATETAFSSLNRIRVKNMAEKGNRKAALVLELSENYDKLLSTILIGNNIVNIASASLATVLFVRMLGESAGPSVSTVVTTVVVLIFGEISPKSIAKEMPEKFAMFSAPMLKLLEKILTPLNFFFVLWKRLLSLVVKTSDEVGITEEELLTLVEEAEHDGGIGEQESTLIRSAIEFNDLEAIDICTPRIDVVGVSTEAGVEEIAQIFAQTGFSRLPLYHGSLDDIEGILYQKDFHNRVYHDKESLQSIIRPALFITPSKKIGTLLRELQKEKSHIAVVIDEFGGMVGIVTLEDILEELVGEIWDEHDKVVEDIKKISDGEYVVSGSANIDKLFEELDIEQEMEVITVSGWVMDELGKIPQEGDRFLWEGWEVTVVKMVERRVDKVRLKFTGQPMAQGA